MDSQLKEKILNILNEMPSENCCIDYKVIDEYKGNMGAFLKDLCAFLNSIEGYGKDKFIILGVSAKQKKILGVQSMQDDKEFQNIADKIEPRPKFETGILKYKEKNEEYNIGYIYIPANNKDRIYSFKENYPPIPKMPNTDILIESKERVFGSTALIRRGSCNKILSEYERREIYETDRKNNINVSSSIQTHYDINITGENDKILKSLILFGGWDESNENDKDIISSYIGKPYKEWILSLRTLLKEKNDILEYKENKWKIINRYINIKKYAPEFFKDEIDCFRQSAIDILSERDPKFDLENDKRRMSNIYKKNTKYSNLLRKSVAETLPMVSSIFEEFKNCKNDAGNLSLLVVREILQSTNWEIWASIGELLPLLAEAAPEEFLNQLSYKLLNNEDMIKKLLDEKEYYITTYSYSTGLYWSLELIAWESRNLIESCMLLSKIAKFDNSAVKHIANIILPWYPQTKAPIENRIIVVKNILKENQDVGWELLKNLMPNQITIATPSYKPKWNNIIEENDINILQVDYWKQIDAYIELAILYSKTNTKKICDLIDIIDDLPKDLFNKIVIKLSKNEITKLNENRKYIIWNHLEDLILWHKKTSKSDKSLPKEAIQKLELLSHNLKPTNIILYAKRYFRKDTWHLIDNRDDYKVGEKKLQKIQDELAKEILSLEYKKIIEFVKSIEDSYKFGFCIAKLQVKEKLETEILNCLVNKNLNLVEFGKGYTYKKFSLKGYPWLNKLNIINWSMQKKLNLLLVLPCNQDTFDFVKKVMGKNENYYWKKVDIRLVSTTEELNYSVKKLLDVKRPDKAIWIISSKLYEDKNFNYDRKMAVKGLKQMLKYQKNINTLASYHIIKIINDLQNSNISKDTLFNIEWSYLPLLDGKECRPITIERTLANNPNVYNDILCLAYKPHSLKNNPQKVDEKIATNAYRLLYNWKLVPGLDNDSVDKKKLNNWYKEMVDICTKSDRLEVGLSNFGKVLFYSPKDNDGFWINKNVAEILNKEDADIIRDGFRIEAFNSLGIINYDSEGSAYEIKAEEYYQKADDADKEGYYRLAKEMRKLADNFKYEAEYTREHYFDF